MVKPIYRLFIDESGDHTYGRKEERPFRLTRGDKIIAGMTLPDYPDLDADGKRFLGLTGCIFKLDYYRDKFEPEIEFFKKEIFNHRGGEQVILHAKDIIQRRGIFRVLLDPAISERFDKGLLSVIMQAEYRIINVVLDKKNHTDRYVKPWHPYHYCFANLLSRYCYFLNKQRAKGDVIAECRGKTENYELAKIYRRIYSEGTRFQSGRFYQQYLTSGEIKIKKKKENINGLQIADILANPLRKFTLIKHEQIPSPVNTMYWQKIVAAAIPKIDCKEGDGKVEGYGIVFIK